MIAGSVASSHHGEPRSTQDIDLVIDPTREQLTRFLDGLEPSRFYVDDALAALASRSRFNVIEPATGFKADFVIRKDHRFEHVGVRAPRAGGTPGSCDRGGDGRGHDPGEAGVGT